MTVLFYECYVVLRKIYTDKTYIKQALLSPEILEKDRAKVTKIVYGVVEKDIELEYIISKLCQKKPKNSVKIIIKIALYNIKYLNKTPFSVTDASVSLLKKMGKGANAGFVNALLRNFSTAKIEYPSDKQEYISVKYSYPLFAVKKLVKKYGLEKTENILNGFVSNTCIRFSKNVNGEEYLIKNNFKFSKTPFENVFIVNGFKMQEDFYNGFYTFQSLGSVAICDNVESGEKLLDCCSAPGGKAVNLSEKFKEVVACELHEHRVELIKSYVKRMKVTNVKVLQKDATEFCLEFLNAFDAVLCDCPCSGLGVVKDNPDIILSRTEDNVRKLNDIQLKIINNCSKYVKKGGYLYYSTCSILSEENENIIQKFLENNEDFIEVKINSKLNGNAEEYGVTYLPDISDGAGFYCCRLKRK